MEAVLSILVLAAIALLLGAFVAWRKGRPRRQIMLMLLLAAVMVLNIAIWTLPDKSGQAPLGRSIESAEQP
ncbi:hypothetical protein U8326_08580 [Tsuneonella sp. CC-YZS046]|uniref:hypothetical protein n=1 Tax=Tsuneonella sp. CC-YZS046 TaxID=3042152 RepID=UPI002D772D21|nr:hypothetical protein [Tsuneonella sp. CC-YZS046]WRO65135.1 hypothetical protein U8326_08580 [Tsuneonella sp. CC-YZS046]